MSVHCYTSEPMVGSHLKRMCYRNAWEVVFREIGGRMPVTKCVVISAETRNAVHEEMAAQGSFDDYLHIVVSIAALFALAHLSVIQPHAHPS